jgi:hypothetical protein
VAYFCKQKSCHTFCCNFFENKLLPQKAWQKYKLRKNATVMLDAKDNTLLVFEIKRMTATGCQVCKL